MATQGNKGSGGIFLERDLLDSEAFTSLNGTAVQVLFRFLRKRVLNKVKVSGRRDEYTVLNNGEIQYTYAEAEKYHGISRSRFADALRVLRERGFISLTRGGGLFRSHSLYRVHVNDTREPWREWTPDVVAKPPTPTKTGFQPGHPHYPPRRTAVEKR